MKYSIYLSTLFLCLSLQIAMAQSLDPVLISSSGGHFESGNSQLSWSLGETIIATLDAGSQQLTQGFHQTNMEVTAIDLTEQAEQISVFPNPNQGQLTVDLSELSTGSRLELYDALGRLLIEKEATAHTQLTLDLSDFSAGHYFLSVYRADATVNIFKIQKL